VGAGVLCGASNLAVVRCSRARGPVWALGRSRSSEWSLLSAQSENAKSEGTFQVTMLPGDGVGPELMHAVKEVFKVRAPAPRWGRVDGGGGSSHCRVA